VIHPILTFYNFFQLLKIEIYKDDLKKSNTKNAIQIWGKYDILHMMYLVGTKQNNDVFT
jgi:hypothetical protein